MGYRPRVWEQRPVRVAHKGVVTAFHKASSAASVGILLHPVVPYVKPVVALLAVLWAT
jgi:cytochrome b